MEKALVAAVTSGKPTQARAFYPDDFAFRPTSPAPEPDGSEVIDETTGGEPVRVRKLHNESWDDPWYVNLLRWPLRRYNRLLDWWQRRQRAVARAAGGDLPVGVRKLHHIPWDD